MQRAGHRFDALLNSRQVVAAGQNGEAGVFEVVFPPLGREDAVALCESPLLSRVISRLLGQIDDDRRWPRRDAALGRLLPVTPDRSRRSPGEIAGGAEPVTGKATVPASIS